VAGIVGFVVEPLALDVVRVLVVELADGGAERIFADGFTGGEFASGGAAALRGGAPVLRACHVIPLGYSRRDPVGARVHIYNVYRFPSAAGTAATPGNSRRRSGYDSDMDRSSSRLE